METKKALVEIKKTQGRILETQIEILGILKNNGGILENPSGIQEVQVEFQRSKMYSSVQWWESMYMSMYMDSTYLRSSIQIETRKKN